MQKMEAMSGDLSLQGNPLWDAAWLICLCGAPLLLPVHVHIPLCHILQNGSVMQNLQTVSLHQATKLMDRTGLHGKFINAFLLNSNPLLMGRHYIPL